MSDLQQSLATAQTFTRDDQYFRYQELPCGRSLL